MADNEPTSMERWLRKQKKAQLIAICLEMNRERNMYRAVCDKIAEEEE